MQIVKRNISQLYVFIINFFLKIYYFWVPFQPTIVPLTILDITDKYIETTKKRFLTIESLTPNINIESTFYDKKEYQEVMQISDNVLERAWKTRILFESTPRGNIIMFFNPYKQGFSYYSDSYNLPYNLLNAVAMKYVMTYKCRDFFMDDGIITSPLIKIHADKESAQIKKKLDSNTVKMIQTRSMKQNSNANKPKEIKKTEPEHNVNRFICMGKIVNFQFIQKPNKVSSINGFKSNLLDNLSEETDLQKKVMDYKAFKNLRSST